MDNLYTRVDLAEELLENEMYLTGTIRKDRGEPTIIADAGKINRLEVGESVDVDNGKVLVSAWQCKTNKTVKFLSSQHDNGGVEVRVRSRTGGELVDKPVTILDYNCYMGGVDGLDQMLSYYPCTRKTIKWMKKLFWFFVEICLHNACISYNHGKNPKQRLSFLDFQTAVITSLCLPHFSPKPPVDMNDMNDGPERTAGGSWGTCWCSCQTRP